MTLNKTRGTQRSIATARTRSRTPRRKSAGWQSLLNWFAVPPTRRRLQSAAASRRLRLESLEERTVLATDIAFDAGTGILTLTLGAAETVNLDVASVADFNVTSDAGTTISGDAASIGFTAETANVTSDGSLATVNRIDIVGSAGVQTVNFGAGTYSAVTVVDGAEDIENVNFNAATTFSNVSGVAPHSNLDVTAATTITQAVGATITTTAGGDVSLENQSAGFAINAAVTAAGDLTLNAAGAVTQTAAITASGLELLGAGPFTLDLTTNNVATIAANVTGAIDYVDADALVVGTVNATGGITTSDDDVSLDVGGTLASTRP